MSNWKALNASKNDSLFIASFSFRFNLNSLNSDSNRVKDMHVRWKWSGFKLEVFVFKLEEAIEEGKHSEPVLTTSAIKG